ncbi:MAG: TonB-dependent receptor [Flavobacteriaceae bacterium CG2_30_34_30]|nr:MAG: TonB-dependent receptor [Flavobacteriaceae bacterium CG2_30_34_30]
MISQTLKIKTTVLFIFITAILFAQDPLGTEVINVVRPYSPTVSDAFKVKETPSLTDSLSTQKKEVNYNIFSVPVASTFTPAKGKATTIERKKQEKLFSNYATLGLGNYSSILAELYSNFQINRTDNVGFFLKHNSSQGGIDNIVLDDKFYNTLLDVNYASLQRDMSYTLDFGVQHQLFNWYGVDTNLFFTEEQMNAINPQHSYFGVSAGGNIKFDEAIFSEGDVRLRYFSDSFSSSEIHAVVQPKFEFDLGGQNVGLNLGLNYLNGSFDQRYANPNTGISYGFLNTSINPYILLQEDAFSVNLGAVLFYSMDTENSDGKLFIYPKVHASYRLVDEFVTVYAGAEGDLVQNSYYTFTQENPFVSPTLFITPTDQTYEGFGGIKGKVTNTIAYNLRASYKRENDKPFFQLNPFIGTNPNLEGYENGNSFQVVYDDLNTLEVFGELQVAVNTNFTLGMNANFFSYTNEVEQEAWNLPTIKASLFANANITEKLYGGVNLFYVGERKDQFNNTTVFNFQPQTITLDSYLDANIHLGYRINEQLSIFAKGSNLLGDTYEKWANFPVLGIQVLAGATYKFDW